MDDEILLPSKPEAKADIFTVIANMLKPETRNAFEEQHAKGANEESFVIDRTKVRIIEADGDDLLPKSQISLEDLTSELIAVAETVPLLNEELLDVDKNDEETAFGTTAEEEASVDHLLQSAEDILSAFNNPTEAETNADDILGEAVAISIDPHLGVDPLNFGDNQIADTTEDINFLLASEDTVPLDATDETNLDAVVATDPVQDNLETPAVVEKDNEQEKPGWWNKLKTSLAAVAALFSLSQIKGVIRSLPLDKLKAKSPSINKSASKPTHGGSLLTRLALNGAILLITGLPIIYGTVLGFKYLSTPPSQYPPQRLQQAQGAPHIIRELVVNKFGYMSLAINTGNEKLLEYAFTSKSPRKPDSMKAIQDWNDRFLYRSEIEDPQFKISPLLLRKAWIDPQDGKVEAIFDVSLSHSYYLKNRKRVEETSDYELWVQLAYQEGQWRIQDYKNVSDVVVSDDSAMAAQAKSSSTELAKLLAFSSRRD